MPKDDAEPQIPRRKFLQLMGAPGAVPVAMALTVAGGVGGGKIAEAIQHHGKPEPHHDVMAMQRRAMAEVEQAFGGNAREIIEAYVANMAAQEESYRVQMKEYAPKMGTYLGGAGLGLAAGVAASALAVRALNAPYTQRLEQEAPEVNGSPKR